MGDMGGDIHAGGGGGGGGGGSSLPISESATVGLQVATCSSTH